jgi:hypothetical protein
MERDRKNVPRLRQLTNLERATSRKASESWQIFTIMAEFIDAAERLSEIRPAVSIFGSARIAWRTITVGAKGLIGYVPQISDVPGCQSNGFRRS